MLRPEEVTVAVSTALDRGRSAYAARRGLDASSEFSVAGQEGGLSAEDLERAATATFLSGNFDGGVSALSEAHEEYLLVGEALSAARCAAYIALDVVRRSAYGTAATW